MSEVLIYADHIVAARIGPKILLDWTELGRKKMTVYPLSLSYLKLGIVLEVVTQCRRRVNVRCLARFCVHRERLQCNHLQRFVREHFTRVVNNKNAHREVRKCSPSAT